MKTEDMNHFLLYFQIHDDLENEHWIDSKLNFPPNVYIVLEVKGKRKCLESHHSWNDLWGSDIIRVEDLENAGLDGILNKTDYPSVMVIAEEHLDADLLEHLEKQVNIREQDVLERYCQSLAKDTIRDILCCVQVGDNLVLFKSKQEQELFFNSIPDAIDIPCESMVELVKDKHRCQILSSTGYGEQSKYPNGCFLYENDEWVIEYMKACIQRTSEEATAEDPSDNDTYEFDSNW